MRAHFVSAAQRMHETQRNKWLSGMLVNAGAVDGSVHLEVVYADDLIYPADER